MSPGQNTKEILKKYLPAEAVDAVYHFLKLKKIHLKITRNRTSKTGDYRPPVGYPTHRISVNHNLNPYSFLITFLHEYAHLLVYEKYRYGVRPHGPEWKAEFRNVMMPFLKRKIFPEDITLLLTIHLENSKASSASDIHLTRALKKYDKHDEKPQELVHLEELLIGEIFIYGNNRKFVNLGKQRTRYKCREMSTGRYFTFHPLTEVLRYVWKVTE